MQYIRKKVMQSYCKIYLTLSEAKSTPQARMEDSSIEAIKQSILPMTCGNINLRFTISKAWRKGREEYLSFNNSSWWL